MNIYPDGEHKATNGIGWRVQWLTSSGWEDATHPFLIKKEAQEECSRLGCLHPPYEFRIYEALNFPINP